MAFTFNLREVTEKKNYELALLKACGEMEERAAERSTELSLSQKRFQELVNTIDGIVWEANVGQPGFSFVSSQAERITGYSQEQWLTRKSFWQSILHPDDLAKITGDRYLRPEQKKNLQTEYRIITAEGKILWFRDHIRVIYAHDRPVKLRGIMVDVTAQKAVEEELRQEREISRRSASAKAEFLANMSHEIRTPLNVMVGMISMALDGEMPAEPKDCLSTAQKAADSLLVLINDILDYSKIEAGGLRLEETDYRLGPLIQNSLDVIRPLAVEKGVRLECQPAAGVPECLRGDPGRLSQILLNLLSNAVKFTPPGGQISVHIERSADGSGAGHIRFAVTDSGIGIDEATQSKLFQPFSQADGSTARKFGGTGLGLSISKRFVNLMGGEIGLRSREGAGSTFWFEVPHHAPRKTTEEIEQAERRHSEHLHGRLAPARILVADDNPANQKVLLRQLEKLRHQPTIVGNGREALAAFQSGDYDLVLMDCQMPELDGYDATRRIRDWEKTNPERDRVPVIALTAFALTGDKEKCFEAGMDDYLSKPVSRDQLARAIGRWAAGPRPSLQAFSAAAAPAPKADEEAIDLKHLSDLEQLNAEGKEDIIQELGRYFLEVADSKLISIQRSVAAGDSELARRNAHSFRSTCLNVGARRLATLCGKIEEDCATPAGLAARLELPLARLEREVSAAKDQLARILRKRSVAVEGKSAA